MPPILVTDFDGTLTRRDFYRIAQACLVLPDTPDYWEGFLSGRLTHFEALQRIFWHIRADAETVMAAARRMEMDPRAGEAAAALRAAGWELVVASAGCAWYIDRLLAAQGIVATVYANPGELDPARGLLMHLPADSPYGDPRTGVDKAGVVRAALVTGAAVAFAGDGRPDLAPALLVPPARRFARGWLADELTQLGEGFHRFEAWSEIAPVLLEA
jgi:2,3-diketo-5-methylthio-1-phosphopentane phosphatase